MNRPKLFPILLALLACVSTSRAAVPPPEELLPPDTLFLLTVPDWQKAFNYQANSPQGRLWQDPAVRPFRDRFVNQFKEQVVTPLERELGIDFGQYTGLLKGQLTLAVTQSGWDGTPGKSLGFLAIVDTVDQADQLSTRLADLKKRWVDAGKQIKNDKIRDVEFTTLVVRQQDVQGVLEKAFPSDEEDDEPAEGGQSFEISFGQSGTLLLVGNTPQAIEHVLIRQSGGTAPALAEQAAYQRSHAALFRDALGYGWINFKLLYDGLVRVMASAAENAAEQNPLINPEKILNAIGLGGLQTVSLKFGESQDGSVAEALFAVPESNRQGIFRLLTLESKDASPPSFVPASVVKFSRWRLDGQKAWAAIESILNGISPELAGVLQMSLSMAGKDKDPNFDVKKNLIGNLGDDFITYQKSPRSSTVADLGAPPAIFLIGSPNPGDLAQAFRTASSMLPISPSGSGIKEREFLGRKIYSFSLPVMPDPQGGEPAERTFNFAAGPGYVGFSSDLPLLEEFLRSTESSAKTLRELSGLAQAAEKVGGMNKGFFSYENQRETMRSTLTALREDREGWAKLFSLNIESENGNPVEAFKQWFDFSLLPPFEQIAKYFHFVVYSASSNSDGLSWKLFAPNPPDFK